MEGLLASPHAPRLVFDSPEAAHAFCVECAALGATHVLALACRSDVPLTEAMLTAAARAGHTETVWFLLHKDTPRSYAVANAAAQCGHMDVLDLLDWYGVHVAPRFLEEEASPAIVEWATRVRK
jgi:hypothetical protein